MVNIVEGKVNKGVIGKVFKKEAKLITEYLASMPSECLDELDKKLQDNG